VKGVDLNPPNGRRVTDGVALAIVGAVCLIFGVIVLVYSLSLDSTARDFQSAAPCEPGMTRVREESNSKTQKPTCLELP
jgi:hypothetical protein